tara:strand:+ start:348 stop:617 length:270 start_codon:yes stop_codon:yes gene_type:complete
MIEFDTNVEFLRLAFYQIIMISGPLLAVALGIGLFIGIIQAATSINEMTLSFVPKVVLVLLALALLSNFMLIRLTDYFLFIFDQVTQIG